MSRALPTHDLPIWIRYAKDLLARQHEVLRDQAAFEATLPAARAAQEVSPDWPASAATAYSSAMR